LWISPISSVMYNFPSFGFYRHDSLSLEILDCCCCCCHLLYPLDHLEGLTLVPFLCVSFLQVSVCYKSEMGDYPDQLHELLEKHYNVMVPIVRRSFVQCLILLRNKDMVASTKYLPCAPVPF